MALLIPAPKISFCWYTGWLAGHRRGTGCWYTGWLAGHRRGESSGFDDLYLESNG
ncbi:hypothetical protein ACK2VI_04310 [Klebsiella pneumoniae]|uniref:hypothetical protein n=1 Tax=Klebsiella pneumoniae TaxID=573 RepID=UPI0039181B11